MQFQVQLATSPNSTAAESSVADIKPASRSSYLKRTFIKVMESTAIKNISVQPTLEGKFVNGIEPEKEDKRKQKKETDGSRVL